MTRSRLYNKNNNNRYRKSRSRTVGSLMKFYFRSRRNRIDHKIWAVEPGIYSFCSKNNLNTAISESAVPIQVNITVEFCKMAGNLTAATKSMIKHSTVNLNSDIYNQTCTQSASQHIRDNQILMNHQNRI